MSELHIVLVKDINGHPTEADLELDVNQLEALSASDQARVLLESYRRAKAALVDAEVEVACDKIRDIIPFPTKDIPIQ